MTPERWEEIQRVFQGALEQPPDMRSGFIARECHGDDALRREVESLLTAGSRANAFLEVPALPAAARAVAGSTAIHQVGDLVGPYQLAQHVGSGGMGEVWRAHDTRLGRDVALKFSHALFSERFAREARAIAALNHPNICQLYDVGPDYLVMEFIEGESPAGPLPLTTVLRYGRQMADALEAAQEKGIIHRDLKPSNIKVRSDGTLKVLDFGLAKLASPSPGTDLSSSAPGDVLGTPAWMSPEQARGLPADKRADIWAFGLILVYLLTGSNPFDRASVSETAAAVLTAEPDWNALPVELRRLIRKCLEKDPRARLRDIGDVWDLLEEPSNRVEKGRSATLKFAWLAIPLLAVAGGFALWRGLGPAGAASASLVRLDLNLGPDYSLDASGASNLVLSPDGSSLAFVSRGQLYRRTFQDPTPHQVGGVQGVSTPFFSPDGQWIAFFAQGKLRKIALSGGTAFDICPTSAYFAGGAWGPDGNIVASLAPSGPLQIVSAAGGTPQPFTELDRSRGEITHRLPQFLPGGKAMLFTSHNAITGFDDADIDVLTLPDRKRKHLIHGGTFGRYVSSGHLLYVSRGVLYAVPFDAERLELRGEPVKVVEDVAYSLFGSAQFDASAPGTLIYRSGGTSITNVTLERFDERGGHQPLLSRPGTYLNPRVSPDGRKVLLSVRGATELTLSMFDAQRDAVSPVVEYDATIAAPWVPLAVWTPDGKFVISRGGWEEGKWGMYWLRAGSSGPPQRLTTSNLSQTPASFSPDGHTLAFYQGSGLLGSSDIWTVTVSSDGTTLRAAGAKPFVETKADENHPSFSRDSHWIAYSSAGQAVPEIYVKPWPDDGRSWQISAGGGSQPLFSRTRDELFFLSADQQIMVVPYRASNDGFTAERPRRWSERRVADLGATFWSYDLLPGQQGFVALTVPDDSRQRTQGSLVVLLNAFDHLRRIAPAK